MSGYVPVKKGTDPTPQIGLPQQAERRGGTDPSSPASQDVVDRHAATISSWVNAQRQNVANSVIPIHARQLDHPEYTVAYSNIHGSESVTVTPKPVPATEPEQEAVAKDEDEQKEDEDLPEPLTAEKQEPTEANPNCLAVFFYSTTQAEGGGTSRTAQIGAVAMKDLATPSVQYQGEPKKTDWTAKPGDLLTILQLKLGDTEFVMLPVDITGKTTATHYHVLTTALGDTTATDASVSSIPVMNGTAELVYTMGGAFSYGTEKGFQHQQSLAPDLNGTTPLLPHAIDTDGTCYFFPQLNSSTPMLLNPACTPTATTSAALDQQASQQVDMVNSHAQSVTVAYATSVFFSTTLEDVLEGSNNSHDNYTVSAKTAQIRLGTDHKAGISGTSYYGSASFGQAVTLQGFAYAEGSQDFSSYNGGGGKNVDAYGIVTAEGTASTLDSAFPLSDYRGSAVIVDQNKYQATQLSHTKVKFDTTQPKTVQTGAGLLVAGDGVRFDNSFNPTAYKQYSWEVDGYDPNGRAPPTPDNGNQYNDGTIEAYYEQIKNDFAGQQGYLGTTEVDMVELTLTSGVANRVAYGSTSGEFSKSSETDTSPWPEDDILEVAVGFSTSDGGSGYSASASSKHFPYSYPTLTSSVINATLSIFGDNLVFSEDTGTSAPTQEAGILVSSFPPMYLGKPYYLRLTGTDEVPVYTVVTPFERFDGVQGLGSLLPWLHVSNGTDCLQGFTVDGVPFIFLNSGAGGNYLTKLADALGCKTTDIVGVVMDVTLEKIKAVANVQPPNYGAGSGAPTGPVSTG